MYPFEYQRPASVAEAAALLESDSAAKALAGGMSLLPAMKLRLAGPSTLVDLRDLPELRQIHCSSTSLTVGAMVRHAVVASSTVIIEKLPALAELAGGIGDRQVRNRGTMGGSVANSDPAACYPAAVLGLGATIRTNRRTIPADGFFTGLFATALEPDELIWSIDYPLLKDSAYVKFHQPASRFALVGVFVTRASKDQVRVAVTGAASHAFRATDLEVALSKDFTEASALGVKVSPDDLNSDLHGDAHYRAALIPVLAARAVERIASRAAKHAAGGAHG